MLLSEKKLPDSTFDSNLENPEEGSFRNFYPESTDKKLKGLVAIKLEPRRAYVNCETESAKKNSLSDQDRPTEVQSWTEDSITKPDDNKISRDHSRTDLTHIVRLEYCLSA